MQNDSINTPTPQTDIPEPNGGSKFQTATLIEHKILASKYHYFSFEANIPLTYKPGQYISVKVAAQRLNSYSIAGSDGPNKFYILVDVSPGGPGSKFFENLKAGDTISYLGPFGIFTLKENDGAKHLLFLGTGSGCSPLKCILEAAIKNSNGQVPISFYFGLRYQSDVFWQDYFKNLADEHPNFKFELVLSKPDSDWHGLKGHITDFVNRENPLASDCAAYLCGSHEMIEEATNILLSHGCLKERIYSEKF